MSFTYRQLAEKISKFSEEQLNSDVTVKDLAIDEFFPAAQIRIEVDTDVLDENHPVIYFNSESGPHPDLD